MLETPKSHVSEGAARSLCYLLGPFLVALILQFRQHGLAWSVRFHAFHALLFGALWGAGWAVLRLIESISPSWFLSTIVRELRFAFNLWFLLIWAVLLVTAYTGRRFAIFPFLHNLAARLARKSEPRAS